MTATKVYTGSIVITTCWCGIRHGVPRELHDFVKRQHDNGQRQTGIYCPLGHTWEFSGPGEAERLRLEKERLERVAESRRQSIELLREQRDTAQRQATAYKGVATKAKKRAAAAACPCCNRTFVQLRRHLATKHPDYVASVDA